ncbi:RagB/SusD family nutrient uptake outer membrane protein [Empedobacter sp.]|uniref:RagB/SusD family nutrient uptake outer membrane protein n=1 Tax=Empedobacter sp. TaxID=1927715 RepID=UPI002899FEE1|nr:RagB/SusD family nutrient uptake outer membrane protein [Empedobacter sp.]
MKNNRTIYVMNRFILLIAIFTLAACNDWIETDDPKGEIKIEKVYNNEQTANAAVASIYKDMKNDGLLSGSTNGSSVLFSLYADELDFYGSTSNNLSMFHSHQLLPSNTLVTSIWANNYRIIYETNLAIEALNNSTNLSLELKNKLIAEVLFIRAFTHFNLMNLYGKIPYITTSNYQINRYVYRDEIKIVYDNIEKDLLQAKGLLVNNVASTASNRATIYAVSALLSKVYLYQEKWDKVVSESQGIVQNKNFSFQQPIENQYKKESKSTIFQFSSTINGENTLEGSYFIINSGPPTRVALRQDFINLFNPLDKRLQFWTKKVSNTTNTQSWYIPYKYKENANTGSSKEFSIVFGLSEIILMRAEAYLHTNELALAVKEINIIREKAGLNQFNSSNPNEIQKELILQRKLELFTEHGNRWFDLKRWKIAEETLKPIKSNWKPRDLILPIPESELLINPNLNPQNDGY